MLAMQDKMKPDVILLSEKCQKNELLKGKTEEEILREKAELFVNRLRIKKGRLQYELARVGAPGYAFKMRANGSKQEPKPY